MQVRLKDVFVTCVKYMPIIQLVGMLFNNLLYLNDIIFTFAYVLDFIIGNSLITSILLYICSYLFGFCKWHRLLIYSNLFNVFIATIDSIYKIPISDLELFLIFVIVYFITLILIVKNKFCK